MPGTPDELSGTTVPVQPPPGSATPEWLATWVAAVQLWGTDNRPTSTDRAGAAETPPRPGTLAGPCTLAKAGSSDPAPGTATAPGCSSLMLDIPLVTAGQMIAGLRTRRN